jgi:imidazolonepropionase-like amidohydrolase
VSARVFVVAGHLFDGITPAYRENAGILIENGEIVAVGQRQEFGDMPDVDVVDAGSCYVMPGLINAHVHLTFMYMVGPTSEQLTRSAADMAFHGSRVASLLLSQGITTARDMGGRFGVPIAARNAIAAGRMLGPRIVSCGQAIAVTGGHAAYLCVEADGADGFRRAARDQLKRGADFIKVMASHDPWPMPNDQQTRAEMTKDEMEAAFLVAHEWGRLASCHVMGEKAIRRAIQAGVNIIEHGHYLTLELAREMSNNEIYLTPTLSSYDVQTMHPRFGRGAAWAAAHMTLVSGHKRALEAALEAGVKLLSGTDSVGCYAEEVALMRAAGLSKVDSLLSCTRFPAKALGMDSTIGTVEPGKTADLVVLNADPLADPYALEQVEIVMQGGVVHRPSDLIHAERWDPKNNMVALALHAPDVTEPAKVGENF